MSQNPNEPTGPFHAGPGTGHEIGVMFGFMAAFVIVTVIYLAMWRIGNRRGEEKEMLRRQQLREKDTVPATMRAEEREWHDMDKGTDDAGVNVSATTEL